MWWKEKPTLYTIRCQTVLSSPKLQDLFYKLCSTATVSCNRLDGPPFWESNPAAHHLALAAFWKFDQASLTPREAEFARPKNRDPQVPWKCHDAPAILTFRVFLLGVVCLSSLFYLPLLLEWKFFLWVIVYWKRVTWLFLFYRGRKLWVYHRLLCSGYCLNILFMK